jgi:hypothetical protein
MFGIALMYAVGIMISVHTNYACNTPIQARTNNCNICTNCSINIIQTQQERKLADKEFNMVVTDIQDNTGNVSDLDRLFEIVKMRKVIFDKSRIT